MVGGPGRGGRAWPESRSTPDAADLAEEARTRDRFSRVRWRGGPGMPQAIAGRTAEIDVLDGLLADRATEPRAVLVEGAPGIGKTTLLRAVLESAREQGY